MKSALLVGVALLILPSQASALAVAERGLRGGFTSATAVAKHENICSLVITDQARKYIHFNLEQLRREAGILTIFAIVQAFRCP
jgi:hypothetical protein